MVSSIIARNDEFALIVDTIGAERGTVVNTVTGEQWAGMYVVSVLAGIGWGLIEPEPFDNIILKHLPGEHDQRRHAPVTVTRGSSNIPKGQYESLASGSTRGQAESQMNKMAGVSNYKDANKKGYYTVKIGDAYHVISTKPVGKPKPAPEPKQQPKAEVPTAVQQAIPKKALIEPGVVDGGIKLVGQEFSKAATMRVLSGLKKLPLSHQGVLKTLQFTEQLADCAGIAYISDRWVELKISQVQNQYGTYSTVHEVGHLLLGDLELYRLPRGRNETPDDRKLRKTAGKELRKLYNKRAKAAGVKTGHWIYDDAQAVRARNSSMTAVTGYAKTNANEFAAESYAFYVLQPKTMRRVDPEAYEVVKGLFRGQEYADAGIKYKHLLSAAQ